MQYDREREGYAAFISYAHADGRSGSRNARAE